MRPYWSVIKARFRMLLQYRAAALAGFGTQLFWGILRVMLFDAFFRSSSTVQPMSYEQTVTYLWLIQALLLLIPWRVEPDLRVMILNGNVAFELARPIDLYWFWYSRAIAYRTAPVVLRATPMFIVAGAFLGLQAPASWAALGAFALAVVGALLLSCAITMLLTVSLLWTVSGQGINRLIMTLATLLSGSIVPLPFFPDWAQKALVWLPFSGLLDLPFRLYTGILAPTEILWVLPRQLAWTAILILFGRWLLSRARRRVVVQGG